MYSSELEPVEPHRVVRLVPLEHAANARLLVGGEHALVDLLEPHTDAVAIVLESLRDHRLELVANAARVGDLDRPRGVIDAREEAHEQGTEDLARLLE